MKSDLRQLFLCCFFCTFVLTLHAQYVTLDGRKFKDGNGNEFFPKCMNYLLQIVNDTGTQNYYITPYESYGPDKFFECHDAPACLDLIDIDLKRISQMGFNTIHLVGLTPYTDSSGMRITTWPNINVFDTANYKQTNHFLSHPYDNDPWVQKLLIFIDTAIIKANKYGLKVILDCQQNDDFYNNIIISDLDDYLTVLASHIHQNPDSILRKTLMSYSLVGEPSFGDLATYRTKNEVCDITTNWYDILKLNDPDHLIDAGGISFCETFIWDPSVVKSDFYFVHFYPNYFDYEQTTPGLHNQELAMKRIDGIFYWLYTSCPKPWMVGETNLSGSANYYPDTVGSHGNFTDQANYVSHVLQKICDCGGSGYSAWEYQDFFWGNGVDDNYGLLKHGNQYNDSIFPSLKKPAVENVINFVPFNTINPCEKPDNYYDRDNHLVYQTDPTNDRQGWVSHNGNPINYAVIQSSVFQYIDYSEDTVYIYSSSFTFTDENGYFNVRPYDFVYPPYPQIVEDMKISATNSEFIERGWTPYYNHQFPTNPPVLPSENFSLSTGEFEFDGKFENQTIYGPQPFILQSWNSLETKNILLVQGSDVEFKARKNVQLHTDFVALLGSKLHVYCTETFPICSEILYSPQKNIDYPTPKNSSEYSDQLQLNFNEQQAYFEFDIVPNPCDHHCKILIKDTEPPNSKYLFYIYNVNGNEILNESTELKSITINLDSFHKGIYFIKVISDSGISTKKMIIK